MRAELKFLAAIDFVLVLTATLSGLYLLDIGKLWGGFSLFGIAALAMFFGVCALKEKLLGLGNIALISMGSGFTIIIYLSATNYYVGTVWLIHTLLFSYYFLGFKNGLLWNTAYLGVLLLIHLYFSFVTETPPYPWIFVVNLFGSLFVSYVALYIYGYNVERIRKERDQKSAELVLSLAEIKEAQQQLVEAEKMAALGGLVAGIAHEINTPVGISLTGITHIEDETKVLLAELEGGQLRKKMLQEHFGMVLTMASSMQISLRSAGDLVRSFKQVSVDQHTEQKRIFNVRDYLEEVLLSLHSKLKYTKVRVRNEVDANIIIYSYPGIFFQIFTNLIINSLVHAFDEAQGGSIIIRGTLDDEQFCLYYEDDGKGIEETVRRQMFNPFFTTRRGKGGSGLGLNIIYNLITHKLKGQIHCDSVPGAGMRVVVKVPRCELIEEGRVTR